MISRQNPSRQHSLIPGLAGWGTYPRAFASMLLLGLTALAGEWVVHQLEYLIEYGGRFGTIMAASPHRFYMAPLGIGLAIGAVGTLCLAAIILRADLRKSRRLVSVLPARLHRFVPNGPVQVPMASIGTTAVLLAVYQAVVYVIQENLEYVLGGWGWPGLVVLVAPQHATVIPLHLLMALCGSLVLWMVAAFLGRSRAVLSAVAALIRLFVRPAVAPRRLAPVRGRIPNLRLPAGILGLRSPPLAV